ncbi:beta-N-acetylhexosaminidase [Actinoplanes couchii]|uniref:beta-N-acetylhexosaminidase n=1 Tax=Actinoplanes couchii TaxID=403638 RepID=A0ABQ3XRZ9_9ACTN|nr:beta-N-acetylhexosaminidase [Actinoplanes couchii]
MHAGTTISGPGIRQFVDDLAADGGPRLTIADHGTIITELTDHLDEFRDLPEPIGVSPSGHSPADERYLLEITGDRAVVRATAAEGLHRGLTTLRQLLNGGPVVTVPGQRIVDTPRVAWRGFSLDVARCFQSVETVRGIVDMLSLYKFNVLHLHLSDNEGWRLALPEYPELTTAESWTIEEIKTLIAYAGGRHVTVIPELDTPGHSAAVLRAYPELGVFEPDGEFPTAYLDPNRPGVDTFLNTIVKYLAEIAPGPYLHIGGDEAFGMPDDLFHQHVAATLQKVRATGKTPIGWQETTRPGLHSGEIFQYWADFADAVGDQDAAAQSTIPPETLAKLTAFFRTAREDLSRGFAQGARVLLSPTRIAYFDGPHAGDAADPAQHAVRDRVGYRHYPPRTLEELFAWDPATLLDGVGTDRIAGVEAALWAETVSGAADAQFLITSRLPGFAERAWSPEGSKWADYRDRLAAQSPTWRHRDWTYFATTTVDWK